MIYRMIGIVQCSASSSRRKARRRLASLASLFVGAFIAPMVLQCRCSVYSNPTLRNPSERHCGHILRSRTVAVIAGLLLDQHITNSSCGACVLFLDFWLGFRFTSPKPWEPSTFKSKSRNVHIKYQFGAWCDFLLNY